MKFTYKPFLPLILFFSLFVLAMEQKEMEIRNKIFSEDDSSGDITTIAPAKEISSDSNQPLTHTNFILNPLKKLPTRTVIFLKTIKEKFSHWRAKLFVKNTVTFPEVPNIRSKQPIIIFPEVPPKVLEGEPVPEPGNWLEKILNWVKRPFSENVPIRPTEDITHTLTGESMDDSNNSKRENSNED